jgi:hypothetical protein
MLETIIASIALKPAHENSTLTTFHRKRLTKIDCSRNRNSVNSHDRYIFNEFAGHLRDLQSVGTRHGREDMRNGRFRSIQTLDVEESRNL